MNKTLTINISGIIFHIEEDAYEKLSKYLSTIKGYFKDSEGRDEIIADIEARIAEILQERINATKQVIVNADVDHAIGIMGKPEEFADESASDNKEQQNTAGEPGATTTRSRLFRDPDDKLLGGVCSGISHYFGIQPLWLRLILGVSVIFFGVGVLFYILLWIVIPMAKTTAEKLEMRGEAVNINNIHKNFTDEMGDLKKRMQDFKKEAADIGSPENKAKFKHGASRLGEFIEQFFHLFGRVLGKIIAVFFILIGLSFLAVMLASFFGFQSHNIHFGFDTGNTTMSLREVSHLLFIDGRMTKMTLLAVALVLGVPTLMMVYSGIRMLFGLGSRNKALRIVAAVLFGSGLLLSFYMGVEIAAEFSQTKKVKQTTDIKLSGKTLYIEMAKYEQTEPNWMDGNHKHTHDLFRLEDHRLISYFPSLDIWPSTSDSFEISVISTAKGATEKDAAFRAKSIRYNFSLKDSVLVLDPSFSFDMNDKWRQQDVLVVVKVPRNKMVYLAKGLKPMVHNSDIDNVQNTYDDEMIGRRWMMTEEGLNCIDCEGLEVRSKHQHHTALYSPESPKTPEEPEAPEAR